MYLSTNSGEMIFNKQSIDETSLESTSVFPVAQLGLAQTIFMDLKLLRPTKFELFFIHFIHTKNSNYV